MNDADLERLLGAVDPAATLTDDRTEAQITADLRRIKGTPEHRISRRWPWIAAPTVAAAAAVIAVVTGLWSPLGHPAYAATPPMLTLTPTTAELGEVMDRALAQLRSAPATEAIRGASFEGWYLQTDVEGEASSVAPQRHEVSWNEDLSGTITVTAGEAYPPESPNEGPTPGTVLSHDVYPAGQAPIIFTAAPPAGAEMVAYLASIAGAEPADATAYLSAVRVLLNEWTLSADQQAGLLEGLRDYDGVVVAGDVTDRLGRPGVALRVHSDSSPHYDYLAIISRETGALIAVESIYTGGLAELPVPAPSVTEYVAWK